MWNQFLDQKNLRNDFLIVKILQCSDVTDRILTSRYHYTTYVNNVGNVTAWWRRDSEEEYFPPLALYQPTLNHFLEYHGYQTPLHETHKNKHIIPYMDMIRSVSRQSDPVLLIWTLSLVAFLPHFKAFRFRCTLFGV